MTAKAKTNETSSIVEQIRAATAILVVRKKEVNERIATLEAERESLLDAPLPRDDIKRFIGDYIDSRAKQYPKLANLPGTLDTMCHPVGVNRELVDQRAGRASPLSLRSMDRIIEHRVGDGAGSLYGFDGLSLFWDKNGISRNGDLGIYFFFGDLIKAKLVEQFDILYPEQADEQAGPSVEERRQRLAEIAEDLDKLRSKLVRLDDELAELASAASEPAAIDHGPKLPAIKRNHSFGLHTDPASKYSQAEVLTVTGFSYDQLEYAMTHEGFPAREVREGVPFWRAVAVDRWVALHAED